MTSTPSPARTATRVGLRGARSTLRRLARRDRRTQRGAVLALVALGAIALLGAVGLGIDGSRMLEERRHAQAAADHAAMAAAFNACTVPGATVDTARAAGIAAAAANGFDDTAPRIVVTVDPVVGTPYDYRAVVDSNIDATFSTVLGFGTFDVSAEATSGGTDCDSFGIEAIPTAIYAGGDSCPSGKFVVDVPGSNNEVFGGVHANADASVGGGNNDFDGPGADPWTYVGTLKPDSTSNGNQYENYPTNPQDVGPGLPDPVWPGGWAPSDVTGGTGTPPTAGTMLRAYYDLAVAMGKFSTSKITSITSDGVYYTSSTDGMDISASSGVRNVVLVAPRGPIKVSGSNVNWSAITDAQIDALSGMGTEPNLSLNLPRPGILMLSNLQQPSGDRCDKYTIAVSGSNSDWDGILWGPGGLVEMSGSSNVATNGTLIGWAVRLNGSDLVIHYDSALFPADADPTIVLIR